MIHRWLPPARFALMLIGAHASILAAEPTPSPQALYASMAEASRQSNYDGVFVYTRGNASDSMRVIHRNDERGEQERIVSLSGPVREVVRNNQTVKCILPDSRAVFVENSGPRKFLPSFHVPTEEITANYKFVMIGQDRVADRRAWVIGVLPRSGFRYGYRYWIDTDSRLLLRSEVLDSQGSVLERIVFTQLTSPAEISDQLLQPVTVTDNFRFFDKTAHGETQPESVVAVPRWQIQWMPPGFSLREHRLTPLAASDEPVEHLVYSDGIATISVFIERIASKSDQLQGFTAVGAVNTFSTLNNDYQVTVVGEVPPLTVRQVAAAVAPAATP